jgi:hypothetical protein
VAPEPNSKETIDSKWDAAPFTRLRDPPRPPGTLPGTACRPCSSPCSLFPRSASALLGTCCSRTSGNDCSPCSTVGSSPRRRSTSARSGTSGVSLQRLQCTPSQYASGGSGQELSQRTAVPCRSWHSYYIKIEYRGACVGNASSGSAHRANRHRGRPPHSNTKRYEGTNIHSCWPCIK